MNIWMKTAELSKKYGIAHVNIDKTMKRHGYRKSNDGKYREDQFLLARAAGVEMDKSRKISAIGVDPESDDDGQTLSVQIMKRKIRKMDWEIKGLKSEYEKMMGLLISRADHNKQLTAMQGLCLGLVDNWIDAVSAKRADPELLADLRKCRDKVRLEISEMAPEVAE